MHCNWLQLALELRAENIKGNEGEKGKERERERSARGREGEQILCCIPVD